MTRDQFDGLKCPVPGCKKVIYAFTGLQELDKLQKHMAKAHYARWNAIETLENRAIMEKQDVRQSYP
jgi:hypothetical protein